MPNSRVAIKDYVLFRRDRNWMGRDMRNKGGVAIYLRHNIKVLEIYRSSLYELICLTLLLPSGHHMLVCGLYHPPKHNYQDCDLMNYLVGYVDYLLNKHPDTVVVWGGALNQLDLQHLEALSGWNSLVDFPTRGDSHPDNCLTNRPDLFERCYPIQILIKTDHKGVLLPAHNKLRPVRRKVTIRECRKHRKQPLYLALSSEDWSELLSSTNVDAAVSQLEAKLIALIDRCLPLKTVTMSSRDPAWMSPLVKTLLKKKSRRSCNNKEQLATINRRISELICENRTHLAAPVGSGGWWKTVDDITQRRPTPTLLY